MKTRNVAYALASGLALFLAAGIFFAGIVMLPARHKMASLADNLDVIALTAGALAVPFVLALLLSLPSSVCFRRCLVFGATTGVGLFALGLALGQLGAVLGRFHSLSFLPEGSVPAFLAIASFAVGICSRKLEKKAPPAHS